MFLRILLLFTVVPAVELFLLLQLGAWLGPTATFLLILLTGLVGATLAKREGLGVLRELQAELAQGLPPGSRVMEGVLVVVGGLLLVTPGVFTDLVGFLLIAPPSRRFLAPRVLSAITSRMDIRVGGAGPEGTFSAGFGWPPEDARRPDSPPRPEAPRRRQVPQGDTPFSNPFDDLP